MKKWIIFIIVVVVVVGGIIGWRTYSQNKARQELMASLQTLTVEEGTLVATIGATGRVRSNQSAELTWKTSGTVDQVNVQVGNEVVLDTELATLEQTSLSQSVILAQADLVSAQKSLEDLLNSDLLRAQALQSVEDAEQALEDLLNPELQQAQALQAIADADQALEDAERRVRSVQLTASQSEIDASEAEVVLLKDRLEKAQSDFEPYEGRPDDDLERANFQSALAEVQQNYDAAVRKLNALSSTGSEIDIAEAQADYAVALAQFEEANLEYERIKDGPSSADIALREAQLADAQRDWERLQDGPPADDIAAAEARVAAAQATLDQAHVIAPFAGVVTIVESKPGDQVDPGTLAFRIDDYSRLLVDLEVSEVDINKIAEGQEVVMSFDAVLAKEYHGVVAEVALVGTEEGGVVNFIVTVELLDPDVDIRPGMTSAVNIVVRQLEQALLIPNRAVRVVEGERVVYILDSAGNVEKVVITLGASSDTHSEIVDGDLSTGDEVVLNPPRELTEEGGFGGPMGGGPPR
ncbi:MAG: efflux RND transporter periplasmic adaptor subunit [Anaerolineales bacterium]|nr:efflux RND transporter periplasmic adaptor subunit [Chloroflexota bacterium]MBL6981388.1 efflux RND transporter periplasmic adaptor subunit [Anaerolineales bacterium]